MNKKNLIFALSLSISSTNHVNASVRALIELLTAVGSLTETPESSPSPSTEDNALKNQKKLQHLETQFQQKKMLLENKNHKTNTPPIRLKKYHKNNKGKQ